MKEIINVHKTLNALTILDHLTVNVILVILVNHAWILMSALLAPILAGADWNNRRILPFEIISIQKSQICNDNTGSYTCACNSGYSLSSDNLGCSNINECATGTHNCNLKCTGIVYFVCSISFYVRWTLKHSHLCFKMNLVHTNAPVRVIDGLEVQLCIFW